MKNSYGFGKFEVLTVIVLLMIVSAYLLYCVLNPSMEEKVKIMKNSAIKFGNTAATNNDTFHNLSVVYLGEVQDEKLIESVKNPFGKGTCSASESYTEVSGDSTVVTYKCGKYLINGMNLLNTNSAEMYEVSDWSDKKSDNSNDEKVLYNCTVNGKEKFPEYYDELYFVYLINKEYETDYYYANNVNECDVVSKTFYREKKLYEEKK